ncbi:MAG: methyltransferase domain-containing protein [Pseudomonadota bacterium]
MSAPDLPDGLWTEPRDAGATKALYDDWATRYDADMAEAGMVGPTRVAEMVAGFAPDRAARIWDFGCGTGLCGVALAEAGYTDIRGSDISQGMIDQAKAKGVYRDLILSDPDAAPGFPDGPDGIDIVTACGSICVGAAPAPVLGQVARAMPAGALLIVTLNDDTIRDADHVGALADLQIDGTIRIERAEYGPQMPALGRGATVAALRRL